MQMNAFGDNNDNKKFVVGIDLGTTNCCVSVMLDSGEGHIIPLPFKRTLPSAVMYMGGKDFIVGEEAYRNRHRRSVAYSFKRVIGSTKKYTLVSKSGEEVTLNATKLSTILLKEIKRLVSDDPMFIGLDTAVISVPAYFNDKQRKATLSAAKSAKWNVLGLFDEPSASAITYSRGAKENNKILVYDLGGGTFDLSLVSITKVQDTSLPNDVMSLFGVDESIESKGFTNLNVETIRGDMHLGGDDLDEYLLDAIIEQANRPLTKTERQRLLFQIEQCKKAGPAQYDIQIGSERNELNFILSEKDFTEATKKLFDRTKILVDEILSEGHTFDKIILNGGSTKNKSLIRLLEDTYKCPVLGDLNPDESVAVGASIQAKKIVYGDETLKISEALGLAIGILADGRVHKLVREGSRIPISVTRKFSTSTDNQERISVEVYQGNKPQPRDCVHLGTLVIDNLPRADKGKLPIYVKLIVDNSGMLSCRVSVDGLEERTLDLKNVLNSESDTHEGIKDNSVEARRAKALENKVNSLSEELRLEYNTLLKSSVEEATAFLANCLTKRVFVEPILETDLEEGSDTI